MEKELELFKKYSKKKDDFFESDTHPMHPNLFHQLSMVVGFNKINGRTYQKYVTKWFETRKTDAPAE